VIGGSKKKTSNFANRLALTMTKLEPKLGRMHN